MAFCARSARARQTRGRGQTDSVRLSEAMAALGATEVVAPASDDAELTGCFAADLMSDVLAFGQPGSLLITGLALDQAVRTAAVKGFVAVVVVEGKETGEDMVETARDEAMPLYRTPLSKFEACGILMQAGIRPYRRGA